MPGGGACGWPLEAQAITQVYEVRAVLDGLAARRAAQANAELDPTIILEGRRAAAGQRIGSMIDADMQFHHLIYAASGNPLIAETANHHWPHIRRAMGRCCKPSACAVLCGTSMRRSCRRSTAVMRTWRSGWHVSTARVPATILPPSSPARCVHCLSDWPGRWRRHDTPAHRGPTAVTTGRSRREVRIHSASVVRAR